MGFLDLPSEILLSIAENLETERDIYSLLRTGSKLYRLLLQNLYRHNVKYSASSALPWCIAHGETKGVSILLRMGAPLKGPVGHLPSASDFADDYGFGEDYGSALHFATTPEMAKLLIDSGADVNELSTCWRAPLHVAVENRDLVMAKMLLDYGADINVRGDEYIDPYTFYATPLHHALHNDIDDVYLPMAKLLVKRGADLSLMDNRDDTPLFIAITYDAYATTKMLLEHNAPVNLARPSGETPLHRASSQGNVAIAKLLLVHGALVNTTTIMGRSPLREALEKKNTALVLLLHQYGALD